MAWEKERRRVRNASQPVLTGSALRFTMTARLYPSGVAAGRGNQCL